MISSRSSRRTCSVGGTPFAFCTSSSSLSIKTSTSTALDASGLHGRVGSQNSVRVPSNRVPSNRRFAGRTPILAPHREDAQALASGEPRCGVEVGSDCGLVDTFSSRRDGR
jgi:hypothetical protein